MNKLEVITIEIKSNYGREAIYPTNEKGKKILELTGTKTFSRQNLETLKELGFYIEVMLPEGWRTTA